MSNKPQAITETIVLKDGREVTIETGKLAKQADGAVVVKNGWNYAFSNCGKPQKMQIQGWISCL